MDSKLHTRQADGGQCQTVVCRVVRHAELTQEKIEAQFGQTLADWTQTERDRFVKAVSINHGYKLTP